jgi:hypothetical protein
MTHSTGNIGTHIAFRDPKMTAMLFYSIAVGPVAWAADEQLGYSLVYHACSTGHHYLLHVVGIVCLLLGISGAVVGWMCFGRAASADPQGGGTADRAKFMAILGIAASVGSVVLMIAQSIPRFMLTPCE